jgi:hypothetical protein
VIVQGGCPAGAACTAVSGDNPLLSGLGFHGGPTRNTTVKANSPAVDGGNDATCATSDQRGIARPQGAHCDIGAFER